MPAHPLRHRLAEWRALAAVAPVADDPQVAGGRQAEWLLHTLVATHCQFRGAALYPNRRVPAGRRRREIDLIVVSPHRLHLIEVKNWSGALHPDGDTWVQVNRRGEAIRHPDPARAQRDKADALFVHLRRQGVPLTRDEWVAYASLKVLLLNPRLEVRHPAITAHPDVLTADRLSGYLRAQKADSVGERLLASLAQWCLDSDAAAVVLDGLFGRQRAEVVAGVRAAVDGLGTWDVVRWHGGRADVGDLIRLRAGGAEYERAAFGRDAVVRCRWTRNRWWGLAKALTGMGRLGVLDAPVIGLEEVQVGTADTLLFHKAGDPQPTVLPLTWVDEVWLG